MGPEELYENEMTVQTRGIEGIIRAIDSRERGHGVTNSDHTISLDTL